MNRFLLVSILLVVSISGFGQSASIIGIYGGVGTSINYNYDVGASGGLSYVKFNNSRLGLGAMIFYQGYNFLYDNEANGMHNGAGNAGVTILDQTGYVFVAPKISTFLTKGYFIEGYVDAGVGFKMSGTEAMRKWDRSHSYSLGDFDSTNNTSNNLNSMLIRMAIGFKEYAHMGGGKSNWWFTFTEECAFLTSSVTKSSDFNDPSRTQYSPDHKINPAYFSFQIGISHAHYKHQQ